MDDKDKRDKYGQACIARAIFKLADANRDNPKQLDLLADIANTFVDNYFYFIDWRGLSHYLHVLAHGEDFYTEEDGRSKATRPIELSDVRRVIEADLANIEAEQRESK